MRDRNPNGVFLPRLSFLLVYMLIARLVSELVVYPRAVSMAENQFFDSHEQAKNTGRMMAELAWAGSFVVLALGSCVYYKVRNRCMAANVESQQPLLESPAAAGSRFLTYQIPRALSLMSLVLLQLLAPLGLYTLDNMVRFVANDDLDFKARWVVNVTAIVVALAQLFAFLNVMRPFSVAQASNVVGRTGCFAMRGQIDGVLQNYWLTAVPPRSEVSLTN